MNDLKIKLLEEIHDAADFMDNTEQADLCISASYFDIDIFG